MVAVETLPRQPISLFDLIKFNFQTIWSELFSNLVILLPSTFLDPYFKRLISIAFPLPERLTRDSPLKPTFFCTSGKKKFFFPHLKFVFSTFDFNGSNYSNP